MSIKTKLILVIIGTMTVIGLMAGYYVYRQDGRKLTDHANSDIKNNINYTSQLVNFAFGRAEDDVVNLANNPIIIQAIETKDPQKLAQASDIIQNAAETVSIVKNIALEEVSGSTCIIRGGDKTVLPVVGKDLSSREYCGALIKTKAPYIASALISASIQQFTIPIVVPVKNSAGEVIGLIASAFDVNELRGYLWDLQKDSSVILLDRSGTPFLDTTQEINKLDIPLTAVEDKVKKGLANNKNEDYFQEQNNFIGYKSNGVFTVIYTESNAQLLSFANTFNSTIFLSFTIALLSMSFFIYIFIGTITKRISNLDKVAKQFSGGQFGVKLSEEDLKIKDEIGALANSFDQMAKNHNESYQNIEQKVAERTAEL